MQFITIDSIDDERVAAYTNLTEIQLRNRLEPERGLFIAESPKVIDRALAAPRTDLAAGRRALDRGHVTDLRRRRQTVGNGHPRIRGLPRTTAPAHRIPPPPRGAFGDAALAAAERRGDMPRRSPRGGHGEHRRPHQRGRTDALGAALDVDAVLVTPSCGDPLYRRAARVSMGTVFQIPWTRIGGDDKHFWPRRGLEELRSLGFTTVAMALSDDSISLDELTRRLNNSPESATTSTNWR